MGGPTQSDLPPESTPDEVARRLARAAEDLATAEQLYRAKVNARNDVVTEAVDRYGLTLRAVARAAGITRQRVQHILAGW